MIFQAGQKILFQGDSITDAGRNRDDANGLGGGYAMMVASQIQALHPGLGLTFLNKGISGNRAADLAGRWQQDCLDLEPDWVSVLIGVNDCWRRFDRNDLTPVEVFESHYRDILERSRSRGIGIIICEPFLLPCPPDREAWREDLDPKIHVARKLAREFGTRLVAFDGIFAAASILQPPAFWAADGVHPTLPGHALMAAEWIKSVA
ncbi:MAG: SGNH/GDSL hydrolase family protein [Terrimicrobiaceae bacterium]|nr:SGNH/GDSL hydrolase family protein [Terrimicrobiaceae bacterium]